METGTLCGTPAPFTRDNLEEIGNARHCPGYDGLKNPLFLDRIGEIGEICLLETLARVPWIGAQEFDGDLLLPSSALTERGVGFADQGCKSTPETRPRFFYHE